MRPVSAPLLLLALAPAASLLSPSQAAGQPAATAVTVSTVACRTTPDILEMERVTLLKDKAAWERFILPRLADKRCAPMNRGTMVTVDQRLVRPNGALLACVRREGESDCWWVNSGIQ